jgi:hypothetical protein
MSKQRTSSVQCIELRKLDGHPVLYSADRSYILRNVSRRWVRLDCATAKLATPVKRGSFFRRFGTVLPPVPRALSAFVRPLKLVGIKPKLVGLTRAIQKKWFWKCNLCLPRRRMICRVNSSAAQSRHSFRWSLGRCRSGSLRTVGANFGSTSAIFVTATREPTYTPASAISLHRSLPSGSRSSPICIALHVGRSFPHVLSCHQVGDATGLLEHLRSLFYEQRDILFGG